MAEVKQGQVGVNSRSEAQQYNRARNDEQGVMSHSSAVVLMSRISVKPGDDTS